MSILTRMLLAGALALGFAAAAGPVAAAEPLFTRTDDGTALLYKARPGDRPATVAAMFGVAPGDVPAFLAANGITDATRVGVGHVYRIADPLAARVAEAESKAEALDRELDGLRARDARLARDLDALRASAADAAHRAARLARYDRLWPLAAIAAGLLVGACIALAWLAFAAVRKTALVERRAAALAGDLEEKRRAALAERQHAAKRILDLETKLRELELRAAAPAPARRSPAGTA